ncbi:hypothetical protein PSU4_12120 [Pseudonocardia sulfidoxydans NBRC 16205]|uniref:Uncharacterized protein n=1 Tax=Pseudonocardia sulfidoxydans NBRC 16205 TaxID=1223511 RepID=A0A511DGY1_9PSEU|nr:hypothetical protein [Pseudonocardia sulfidoxydans]GEL22258.1 hypothetical protein PSU4_12120 [Pseudonocardia sulfidoxydans NBRC 16205]
MTTSPLRPGLRLRSRTCTAEVVVVRPGPGTGVLECGGEPMTSDDVDAPAGAADGPGVLLGKRYTDESRTLEVLATKAGTGPLSLDGVALTVKAAKTLPASD